MKIRLGSSQDLPFLEGMLFEATFWRPVGDRPTFQEFISEPHFRKLLAGWGRPGDTALVAQGENAYLGAAWYRLWTDQDHSYGYVRPDIPELGLAVGREHRSRGVGRALLEGIIQEAQTQGIHSLSLSVDPSNNARKLYESVGFIKFGESGTSWTYLLRLAAGPKPNAA
jgi:ribosomal protein S18 acetylase RimI-like enzyme